MYGTQKISFVHLKCHQSNSIAEKKSYQIQIFIGFISVWHTNAESVVMNWLYKAKVLLLVQIESMGYFMLLSSSLGVVDSFGLLKGGDLLFSPYPFLACLISFRKTSLGIFELYTILNESPPVFWAKNEFFTYSDYTIQTQ